MNEVGEKLIQGDLDFVLKTAEERSLGEDPRIHTEDGQPIYRAEEPQENEYRRLQQPPPRKSTIRFRSFADQSSGMKDANKRASRR